MAATQREFEAKMAITLETSTLVGLYPEIEPFDTGFLPCGGKHHIYFEQSGNPHGVPVVVVHGGPGGGVSPNLRRYFNPAQYRIIMFDQRGCGQSKPHASEDMDLSDNTTWHLVADMEALRGHLQVEKWVVFGGSWGSTLSLAYAITHPQSVLALILRGIFLIRKSEIDWFYQDGASHIWPDLWEGFLAPIPPEERHDMLGAYAKRLNGPDRTAQVTAAKAWSLWEGASLSINGPLQADSKFSEDDFAVAFARIESWYFTHNGFFESEDWFFDNIDKIRYIPTWIIQGRFDVVTPITTAWALHRAWPEATLDIVHFGGHASSDAGITDGLVRATDAALLKVR
jgi:proline iminopeptidase